MNQLYLQKDKWEDRYNQSSLFKAGKTVTQPTTHAFVGLLTIICQPAVFGIPLIPSSPKCGSLTLFQTQHSQALGPGMWED